MAELRFHRSLYEASAVRDTVLAFSRLARLDLQEHEHELLLNISDPHPHFGARLEDEIANYALSATVLARIKAAEGAQP